jgi:hypothetical protein
VDPRTALAPYPAPEAREAEEDTLAAKLGAEVLEYGKSVEGRPLRAIRVPATGATTARVLCAANIHGVEWIGGRVAHGFLRSLGAEHAALRSRAEVWVIPCLNPDGHARTWERAGVGRLATLRSNARGVDLNRNFPRPKGAKASWIPGTGSGRPGDPTYRGLGPLSEPETAALAALLDRTPFVASVSLHSFMGSLIPPKVESPSDARTYRDLCRAFAAAQRAHRYVRLASRLDVFTGELEDHQHHVHRTWALTVEVFPVVASLRQHLRAPSTFWRFNPRRPDDWVANDVPGLMAFFEAALSLGT